MFNPHPPLTAFPAVLLLAAVIGEFLAVLTKARSWRDFSARALLLSLVFSPLTFFSGYWGAENASQTFTINEELIANHEGYAKLFMLALFVTALLAMVSRRATLNVALFRGIYLTMLCVSTGLAVYVGFLGGSLVFLHGAGVSAPKP